MISWTTTSAATAYAARIQRLEPRPREFTNAT